MEQGQASIKSQEETGKQSSESKKEVENSGSKNAGKNGKDAADASKGDYIHVRARRGQATNSHSLAERVSSFCLALKPKGKVVILQPSYAVMFSGEKRED